MDLDQLIVSMCKELNLKPDNTLTDKNVETIKRYLNTSWNKIQDIYDEQRKAGKKYFSKVLEKCRKAIAVDIGWAGSGAVMLNYAVNHLWGLNCEIKGILAGTNTFLNADFDISEPLMFNKDLVSYIFSQEKNRDILKIHNLNPLQVIFV